MESIRLADNATARAWLASAIVRATVPRLLRWIIPSAIATVGLALLLASFELRANVVIGVVLLAAFPLWLLFALAILYPFIRWVPQRWVISDAGIESRGIETGRVPWWAVREWAIEPVPALSGYLYLSVRWKTSWRKGSREIVAPVSADDQHLEEAFRRLAPQATRKHPFFIQVTQSGIVAV